MLWRSFGPCFASFGSSSPIHGTPPPSLTSASRASPRRPGEPPRGSDRRLLRHPEVPPGAAEGHEEGGGGAGRAGGQAEREPAQEHRTYPFTVHSCPLQKYTYSNPLLKSSSHSRSLVNPCRISLTRWVTRCACTLSVFGFQPRLFAISSQKFCFNKVVLLYQRLLQLIHSLTSVVPPGREAGLWSDYIVMVPRRRK